MDVKFEDIVKTKSDNISGATSRFPLETEDELSSMEIQVHSHKPYHIYWRHKTFCLNMFHVTVTK